MTDDKMPLSEIAIPQLITIRIQISLFTQIIKMENIDNIYVS